MMYPKSSSRATYHISDIIYNADGTIYQDRSTNVTDYNIYVIRTSGSGAFRNGWHLPSTFSSAFAVTSQPVGEFRRTLSGGRYEVANYRATQSVYLRSNCKYIYTNLGINKTDFMSANISARSSTECLNKIAQGNLRLGVAIAESKLTVSLLARQTVTLLRAYSAARRGNWKEVTSLLLLSKHTFKSKSKDISGRWLELQYGWLPLLSDIKAAYDLLTKVQLPSFMPLRATRTVGFKANYVVKDSSSNTGALWNYTDSVSVNTRLWYYISSSRLAWAASLGLLNPLEIIWEKTAYSFVIDWFLPVGNLIQSLTDHVGCTFLSGTRTWRVTSSMHSDPLVVNGWDGVASLTGSIVSYERETLSSFPIPQIYAKSPFSGLHLANALGLIRQRFR